MFLNRLSRLRWFVAWVLTRKAIRWATAYNHVPSDPLTPIAAARRAKTMNVA
jgi:hypothetical protein